MISKLAELSALNRALLGRIQIECAAQAPKALDQTEYLERTVYRDGYLPSNHPVLKRLFEGEKEATQLVRIALRPAVYICGLWVARDGRLIPAEPPVIPRDLLAPQADDRFTLNDVAEQDRFLSKAEPRVWSESEAQALLEATTFEAHSEYWKPYYALSQKLFEALCPTDRLKEVYVSADEARIAKVDEQLGAAEKIIGLYDWLSENKPALPLLESYALSRNETYQPCVAPLPGMPHRLGHANGQWPTGHG